MSNSQQQPINQQVPTQVNSVLKTYVNKIKNIKNIQYRPFLQDIVTFLSIIGAYQYVSLTFQKERDIQKLTGIQFTNTRTQAIILLLFALYLIFLKIFHYVAYKYDTAPPKKIIPENWEQMQETSQPIKQTPQQKNSQKILPADSYSVMIDQLIQYSIYGFVFMFCTTSYTFISVFNKKNNLVEIEQINYLILWFVTANVFYGMGKILGRFTGVKTLHHFGMTIGIIILLIQIGLAHGLNTFIFI